MKTSYLFPQFIGFLIAVVLFLGTSLSLEAQIIQDLGEVGTHQVELEFKSEISELNAEINQPPANVNTEDNQALITGYSDILNSFFEGADLQVEFLNFLQGGILQPTDEENNQSQTYTTGPNVNAGNPLQDVIDLVEGWDLRANDISDLEEAFQMIRTIKNQ